MDSIYIYIYIRVLKEIIKILFALIIKINNSVSVENYFVMLPYWWEKSYNVVQNKKNIVADHFCRKISLVILFGNF